jgi:FkbM family methyltransferase
MSPLRKLFRYGRAARRAGFQGTRSLARIALGELWPSTIAPTFQVRSRYSDIPLACRRNSSDGKVFYQVFANREYACFDNLTNVGLIIDCGANVGYTAAYFMSRHPRAELIAVEPDEQNFRMMTQNLAPFGDRVRLVRAGIWSRLCGLALVPTREGNEWGVQVREAADAEIPDVTAVDIPTLLRESGHSRISILKIDVEGSEAVIFNGNCDWLDAIDHLAIELHGSECESTFSRAIAGRGFQISRSGELTVANRRSEFPPRSP